MSKKFNSTFRISIHYNDSIKEVTVLCFSSQKESLHFLSELQVVLGQLFIKSRKKYSSIQTPTSINLNQIPKEGIKVSFRFGECFEHAITWIDPEIGTLVRRHDTTPTGECGILIQEHGGIGYAGYEELTKTYWRYQSEAHGDTYREHCLQILEVL